MTLKHFQALATLVRWWGSQDAPLSVDIIANDLATFCQSHNPGFDRERFLTACKLSQAKN